MSEGIVCRFNYTAEEVAAVRAVERAARTASGKTHDIISWSRAILLTASMGFVIGIGLLGVVRLVLERLSLEGWDADAVAPWSLAAWPGFAVAMILLMALARKADKVAPSVPEHSGQTATIDEAGVTLATDYCESRYRWDAYVAANLSQGAIVLRDRLGTVLVLPERGFGTPADRDRAWSRVKTEIQQRR